MDAYLEVVGGVGRRGVFPLTGERATVGASPANDLPVDADPTVSRLHAILDRYAAGWCVRDVGSRNGTFVNGERVVGERALRSGDELRVGNTTLLFRAPAADATATAAPEGPPPLTPRERDVLIALCRPVLSGHLLAEPSSVKAMAAALFLTESSVKKHLLRLYDKFGLHDPGERRRSRLANVAMERGAVSLGDLRTD